LQGERLLTDDVAISYVEVMQAPFGETWTAFLDCRIDCYWLKTPQQFGV
jgi:hypothetical protein